MAKKLSSPKDQLLEERKKELSFIQRELPHINEPSYKFNIGDEVVLGRLKSAIVKEILYDGKAYGLLCVKTNENYGHPYDEETYRVVSWTRIRPKTIGKTNFAKNQDVRLYFNNTEIESLINKHYHFGVDFDPEYQRGYVWTKEDKELLLDSVFHNIDIGKFVFVRLDDSDWLERNVGYEILDGKQRLSTLIEFYENKIPYKGVYFNDLSGQDKAAFLNHNVSFAEVQDTDKATILQHFLMLNRSGKTMSEEHLQAVEEMLRNEESHKGQLLVV